MVYPLHLTLIPQHQVGAAIRQGGVGDQGQGADLFTGDLQIGERPGEEARKAARPHRADAAVLAGPVRRAHADPHRLPDPQRSFQFDIAAMPGLPARIDEAGGREGGGQRVGLDPDAIARPEIGAQPVHIETHRPVGRGAADQLWPEADHASTVMLAAVVPASWIWVRARG